MRKVLKRIMELCSEHVLFVGATIFSAGIYFVYSIYVKAYIEPLEYGIYSTCSLLQTYMAYLQLGSLNAFNRDYPQLVGAGRIEEAKRYRNTVFSFLLFIYCVGLTIVFIWFIAIGRYVVSDERLLWGFLLMAIISVASIIECYGNYRCRIDKGFKYSSFVALIELLSIPIGVVLVPKIGYYSLYIISFIAVIIKVIMYFKPSYSDFKFTIDRMMLRKILISGFPLLINGLIWTVINSIDKFVILGYISTEALGIYGIAQNAFSYMILIPISMSQLFYVKMGKEYGKNESVEELLVVSLKLSTVLAAVTSLIALVAYYYLPILVDAFMPNYSSGVRSSQILILGLSVYAATLINGNILTILKKNAALLANSICMCVFNVICSIGFVVLWGAKIENAALGTAASYILCTLILIYQVHKYAECRILSIFKASIVPVCISLLPTIIFYKVLENKIVGSMVALSVVVSFYALFYRKQILSLRGND